MGRFVEVVKKMGRIHPFKKNHILQKICIRHEYHKLGNNNELKNHSIIDQNDHLPRLTIMLKYLFGRSLSGVYWVLTVLA